MNNYALSIKHSLVILTLVLVGMLGFEFSASAQSVSDLSMIMSMTNVAADAQTHPCDQAASTNVTLLSGAQYRLQVCLPQADNDVSLLVTVDTTVYDKIPITAKTGPSATGMILYETAPFFQVAKGSHSLTSAAYNTNALTGQLQLGATSVPFPFAAVDDTPLPAAPVVKGLIKG